VQPHPPEPAAQVSGIDRVEPTVLVDVLDAFADVERVVVLLLLFVRVERFAVAECPLALSLALLFLGSWLIRGGLTGRCCHRVDLRAVTATGARRRGDAAGCCRMVGYWRGWIGRARAHTLARQSALETRT